MEIDGILERSYVKDDIGVSLRSGDICINTDYLKFIRKEGENTIIDLSSLSSIQKMDNISPNIYSLLLFGEDKKKIQIPVDNRFKTYEREWLYICPNLMLIEIFEREDGKKMPFVHSYNIQYTAWPLFQRNEPNYNIVKLEERDISKIFLRAYADSEGHSRSAFSILAKKPDSVKSENGHIDLCYKDMKCSRLLSKTQKGIAERSRWAKKSGHFPIVRMEFNGTKENVLTEENFNSQMYLLSGFYNADPEIRDLKLFCRYSGRSHEEVFYKFKKSSKTL